MINHICPTCKMQKLVPQGMPATCNYCSEQMVPTASVAGRRILDSKNKKENRK